MNNPLPSPEIKPPIIPVPPQPVNDVVVVVKGPVNGKARRTLSLFTIGVLLLLLAWFLAWWFYFRFYESTDDAYVNGNMLTINSVVSGPVTAFFADDTDLVKEGQLLVTIDETNFRISYDKELANLAKVVLDVRQLFNTVTANQANVQTKAALLAKASYDYNNRKNLVDSQAVSNEEFIHARDDFLIAELALAQAQSQLQVALDAVGNTTLEQHPQIESQKAVVREAYYRLLHCSVYAPSTGYIAQRIVEVGQWASPSVALMAIIPIDYMWIDANFKETELTDMRIGQPAVVWTDIYGSDVKYEGKVLGIASGTGSIFSLIPPQNATGNWIKIVQRLPVRISLDPQTLRDYPLRLGLSAEVRVHIVDRDLPKLAQQASTKAIATTRIFDLDLSPVDLVIEEIIRQNSHQIESP